MGTLGSKLFFKGEDGIFFFYFFLTSVNWDFPEAVYHVKT